MTLTTNDLKNLKELIEITFDEKFDQKIGEKLKYLPTKEEFYASEDKVLKELQTVREEMQILNGLHQKVNDHETRIEKVENKLIKSSSSPSL